MKKLLAIILFGYFLVASFAFAEGSTYSKREYTKDELLGKIIPSTDFGFTLAPKKLTTRKGVYVRNQALYAFAEMQDAAKKDGVNLLIVSGTRNFFDQKAIWEDKWNGWRLASGNFLSPEPEDDEEQAKIILQYSAMPGTSRHHWGTDIDINSVSPYYFTTRQGQRVYQWLVQHGDEYGFCQTYTKKGEERSSGHEEEKWHWSYMPLSSEFLKQYRDLITEEDIANFKGSETAKSLEIFDRYVDSINPECSNFSDKK